MRGGELAHVTVADVRHGDASQSGYGGAGSAPDPLIGPLGGGLRPGHFAALMVRDLGRRTGSGSPSIRIERFAWWDVRPTPIFPQVRGRVAASLIVAHEASFRRRARCVPDDFARAAPLALLLARFNSFAARSPSASAISR
jgi:hypothetical protein